MELMLPPPRLLTRMGAGQTAVPVSRHLAPQVTGPLRLVPLGAVLTLAHLKALAVLPAFGVGAQHTLARCRVHAWSSPLEPSGKGPSGLALLGPCPLGTCGNWLPPARQTPSRLFEVGHLLAHTSSLFGWCREGTLLRRRRWRAARGTPASWRLLGGPAPGGAGPFLDP